MKSKIFLLFVFLLFSVSNFNGQQISKQPILRIEAGMHIGNVRDTSASAIGNYFVTASDDKTIRVWELYGGQLLSILRPQIGEGHEGEINAVSISPDGRTIAGGGYTSSNSEWKFSIYIFDRESEQIVKRISDLSQVILHLTYSPDGKYLAVLLGNGGLQLYETNNYQLLAEDKDATYRAESLDFDPTGKKIITSSLDGFLRLYEISENQLRLVKKRAAKGGKLPYKVRFSPDGASIAVGFLDTLQIKVISSFDLSVLYEPDISKVSSRELSSVAWSADGRTLYAAGSVGNINGINPVCYWTNNGREYGETAASISSIFDLEALPTGGVGFGGGGPSVWGVLDSNNRRTVFVNTKAADFRDTLDGILVNEDTTQVRFSFERHDQLPALFSLQERKLEVGNNRTQNLKSPQIESNKLKITGWKFRGTEPRLNGKKLQLLESEASYSLSILPNNKTFVLGTAWFLRLFDKDGDELWQTPTPAIVWSVNNDKAGKFTIAAHGDGTVRWYRTSDGQELLAFFAPNDNSGRWILWTPSGYYDASPDAEDLIGWHVNNGKDAAADFFPNHLFGGYFYRPDVIDRVLQTADETLAVKLANEKANRKNEPLSIAQILPPVVELNSPKIKDVSDTTVKFNYNIRSHSGEPITDIKALIDGREVKISDTVKSKNADGSSNLTIQIPKKDSELSLIAENKFTKSLPAKIKLKWQNQ